MTAQFGGLESLKSLRQNSNPLPSVDRSEVISQIFHSPNNSPEVSGNKNLLTKRKRSNQPDQMSPDGVNDKVSKYLRKMSFNEKDNAS